MTGAQHKVKLLKLCGVLKQDVNEGYSLHRGDEFNFDISKIDGGLYDD